MPRVVSVEESSYYVPSLSVNTVQYGYRAHQVPYHLPVGVGRDPILHYRTEYVPDNHIKTSVNSGPDNIRYWKVTLDDGRIVHLAWYLFVPKPQPGDEFDEYVLCDFPIWVRLGDQKTYSNLVLGAGATVVAGVVCGLVSLFFD